ncbi:lactate utilization protein C [Bacillaceae bacterium SIJ1]|uniref:LutC/YkgG family protein n=1 Tax=Litoribacterium kuwaitense TaxID=1398745 RepID=UPI0013EA665E|nr:lactate utilization protein C [Litoribacterium kuwaitense]NGP46752.1 lactate utilization protein C [Litoribacterium kuwaitense]
MENIEERIHGKAPFLEKVASALGRERQSTVERPKWHHSPQERVLQHASADELVTVLEAQCQEIHTELVKTSSQKLREDLGRTIEAHGGGPIAYWNDQRFEEVQLADWLACDLPGDGIETFAWNDQQNEQSVKFCEQANIGITFTDCTLAESGTVMLCSGEGKGRSVSLLPATYIALIPKSTLVPRLTQAMDRLSEISDDEGKVPSCINWISGPSNSADIEMSLVVGVHGPIKATYVLIEDL